ncbi:MAG: hypothetical protein WCA95_03310 [Opitutaceae bacterium]
MAPRSKPSITDLLDPRIVREMKLETPAKNFAERIFRFSIYWFLSSLVIGCVLFLTTYHEQSELRRLLWNILGVIDIACICYMLCYTVLMFVKSTVLKFAWWGIMGLIVLLVILELEGKLK